MGPEINRPMEEYPETGLDTGPAAGVGEGGTSSSEVVPASSGGGEAEEFPLPEPTGEGKPMGAAGDILTNAEAMELPGVPDVPLPLPVNVEVPSDPNTVELLISEADMKQLWAETSNVQAQVEKEIVDLTLAAALIERIEKARAYLLAGKDYFNEADRLVGEVQHRLEFQRRVKMASRKVVPWLFAYEIFWMICLGAGLSVLLFNLAVQTWTLSLPFATINIPQFLNSLLWGGLGGVVGALYALWRHTSDKQDFDAQYAMWYITNPILGVALGAVMFLIIQAGFISLTAGSEVNEPIRSAAIIYVFSWISGFKQNVVYEIVRRILDVFRVELPASNAQEGEKKAG